MTQGIHTTAGRPTPARGFHHPGRLVVTGFVVAISIGTLLLSHPAAMEPGRELGLLDALFTATSAVCVTGLVTVDTGTTFSLYGELVILALIQVGGLGIMTIATFATLFLSHRMGIRRGQLAGTEIGVGDLGDLRPVIRAIMLFTFGTEAVVAAVLALRFWAGEWDLAGSLYLGVFHAVSAFNNAGFSNLQGGLERFVTDPVINTIVPLAIILGGIGFPVVLELARERRSQRWSLHTKLTLAATAALLVLGTLAVLLIEWSNPATLGPLDLPGKLMAAFFQGTTPRTAGFNTVPFGELRTSTLLVVVLFMVIGGSSGSTAGGIKTSTFAVVVWTTIAELRGDAEVSAFERRIPGALQRQAVAIVIAATGVVGTSTFVLSLLMPAGTQLGDLLFEVASAFGTVGLSTGVTPVLGDAAKVLVSLLMLLGRVGPTTLGAALLFRRTRQRFRYPEERLMLG